jgi:hypothetical protein
MNKKTINMLILITLLIIIGFVIWFFYNNEVDDNDNQNLEVLKEIKAYDYQLTVDKTNLFKELFSELANLLKDDNYKEEDYAELVAKLFVTDFYDLASKLTKDDVGGLQFVSPLIKENFLLKAKDTIYHHIESNIYGDRKQELPSVTKVDIIDIKSITFQHEDIIDEKAYEIIINCKYKKDIEYPNEIKLTIIHEGSKLNIVAVE